jgi:hypothetical protein
MSSPKRPLFREVNDRIRDVTTSLGPDSAHGEILLCECGREGCEERLEVPLDVYEVVRSEGQRYLVAPGHEEPGDEQVVAGTPGYLVIALRPEPV